MNKFNAILYGLGKIGASYASDRKTKIYFDYISHAQVLRDHPNFKCLAAIDPKADTLKEEAVSWNIPVVVKRVEEISLSPNVAVIATPPSTHLAILESLPKSVKAVILEKPLSTSLVDSKKIINLCAERDITVLVNYWRRFDTILAEWKKQLNNKIGELQFATAYYGGGLMNNGSHVIDCIRYLCGEISDFKHLGIEGSFLLTLESGVPIYFHPLNFKHYREISISLWGTKGSFELIQEGLNIRYSPVRKHRALSDGSYEIDSKGAQLFSTGASSALYNLYESLGSILANDSLNISDCSNALKNETLLFAMSSHH